MSHRPLRRLAVVAVVTLLGGLGSPPPAGRAADAAHYFPETQHVVVGSFWTYWQQHGGLAQQGYPLSPEFLERSTLTGQVYQVQYFERAVFEHHPENAGTPFEVLLSQLGTYRYQRKYPHGAPGQAPAPTNRRYFPETKHTLGGLFRAYWEQHGGLAQVGYPISDEFREKSDLNGQTYLVQYFERAEFELHLENAGTPFVVLLAQLGTFQQQAWYPAGPPPPPPPPPPPLPSPPVP